MNTTSKASQQRIPVRELLLEPMKAISTAIKRRNFMSKTSKYEPQRVEQPKATQSPKKYLESFNETIVSLIP
jgi:hypothetical protein